MSPYPFAILAVLCALAAIAYYRDLRAAERRCELLRGQRNDALKAIDTYHSACEKYGRAIESYRAIMDKYEAILRGGR